MTPGTGADPFLQAPHTRYPDRALVASTCRRITSLKNDQEPPQDYGHFLIAQEDRSLPTSIIRGVDLFYQNSPLIKAIASVCFLLPAYRPLLIP